MLKRSTRYFTLVLTLVALTATVRPAHAYGLSDDDPCSDPSTGCVVGNGDPTPPPPPPPTGQVVMQNAGSDSTANSQSTDDLVSYLMVLYGLA